MDTQSANEEILSNINHNTAKGGYNEEILICDELNTNSKFRALIISLLGNDYDECSRVMGSHKSDIKSANNNIKAQVKKFKKSQFQQLDRHWVCDFVKIIPGLKPIESILKGICERPLLSNETHIDSSKQIKKLCNSNYTSETLTMIIDVLNKYKTEILEYAFYGPNIELQPEYLIGVEYLKNKRHKIVVFKITNIIRYLESLQFKINKRKTVISLDANVISLQRKGGDGGKKSSNQLQVKIIVSKLVDKVKHLEYTI